MTRPLLNEILAALFLLSLALVSAAAADDLPDVRPEISGLIITSNSLVSNADVAEGCAGAIAGRRLLRFDQFTWNDGPGVISLGDPGCPDCTNTPNPVCTNPLFECSVAPGHNHPHLKGFAGYTVRRASSPKIVARGHKEGWCLVDERCNDGVVPLNPQGPNHLCTMLTPGCADIYPSDIGCQYVDITRVPPGDYILEADVNTNKIFPEANYTNNTATLGFRICRPTHSITVTIDSSVQPGSKSVRFQATVPLQRGKTFNPLTTPVHIVAASDGAAILDVTVPANPDTTNCAAVDNWSQVKSNSYSYTNTSGLSGSSCTDSSRGLQQIQLKVSSRGTNAKLDLQMRLPSSVLADLPHGFVVRLIQDEDIAANDTCDAADTVRCRYNTRNKNIIKCH